MSKILTITDENFDKTIENGITLIQFTAEWCGPCRMLGPVIEDLAKSNEDVAIGKLNVDKNPVQSVAHGVTALPTLIFFKDGEPVERLRGAQSKVAIQKVIEKLKGAE
jgi:thioredoxin 1